jgi:hypothetical protein
VRTQLAGLDEENAAAWRLYRQLSRRVLGDLEARGVALDRLTRGWSAARFDEVIDRLNIIHDTLQPPTPTES